MTATKPLKTHGSIAHNPDWINKPGRPMASRTAKLQSVARPKRHIPVPSPTVDGEGK